MMKKIIIACLFCLLFTGGISIGQDQGYRVYKSIATGEQGDLFVTVPLDSCSEAIVCDGFNSLTVYPDDQFQICWTAGSLRCETGPLIVSVIGMHYFKIYGFDGEDFTPPSNEAVLIVKKKMDTPSGCSIRRF